MKIRDLIVIFAGAIATFVFVGFMFNYYIKSESIEVSKRKMKLDSLILKDQSNLHKKDSMIDGKIKLEDAKIRAILNTHDREIKKIKEDLESLK